MISENEFGWLMADIKVIGQVWDISLRNIRCFHVTYLGFGMGVWMKA